MWYPLTLQDLKDDPTYAVEAYDSLCDFLGSRPLRMKRPTTLVSKGHLHLYCMDGKLRGEMDQKLVREICGSGEPLFITSGATVEKTCGCPIRWLGKDPKGLYPRCKGWYGRKVGGKMRARAMVEFPLRSVNEKSEIPDKLTSDAQLKRLKRTAFRY